VRINDRGRVIDVTPAGARALGFSGLAPVKLELAQN
jgi:rare lipoprotein A (peptidoglycan hydrolase)